MRKLVLFIIVSFFAIVLRANEMAKSQALGEEMARAWVGGAATDAQMYAQSLREKNPFSAPNEKSLFEQGVVSSQESDVGKFINEQRTQNPAWTISDKDRLWDREKGEQSCELHYLNESCIETPHVEDTCIESLQIEMEPSDPAHFDLDIYAASYAKDKTTFYFDLKNGTLFAQDYANTVNGWSTPTLSDYDCQRLSFHYLGYSFYHDSTIGGEFQTSDVVVEAPTQPSCANNLSISFKISQTHHHKHKWKNRGVKHLFKVTYQPPSILHEKWTQHCLAKNQASYDKLSDVGFQETCLEGPSTKNISGIEVTRDCWKRKKTYLSSPRSSACSALREKGCEQLKSACIKTDDTNNCLQFENHYRCPQSSCQAKKESIEVYCQTGDCFSPKAEPLGGFEEAISHLGGAIGAGHDMEMNQIFKGQAMTCRKMGVGFSNCCQDKGWGQDLHLTSCKEEEKLLGMAKEASRVIEVGEFCDNKIFGECLEKKKSYCVYPSKLAKIIQQGAIVQLDRSLGEADNPLCIPLTPQDLQALNWDQIDFSELYEDIRDKTSLPVAQEFAQKIQQSVNLYSNKE